MPIHRIRALEILEFYTPCPPSLLFFVCPPLNDPFPNKVAPPDIFLNIYQIIAEHFPTITRIMQNIFLQ